jgi:outer membrane murein-binding lipoprotein Lpp
MTDDEITVLTDRINDLDTRVRTLEVKIETLSTKIDMIANSNETIKMILQYVVTPVLIILGALVGVKIALP